MSPVVFPYLPTVPLWVSLIIKCPAFDLLESGKNTENSPSHVRLDSGPTWWLEVPGFFYKTQDCGFWSLVLGCGVAVVQLPGGGGAGSRRLGTGRLAGGLPF